jgi:tRNA A-37 threonylcarbamoyl transferase component Bud32
VNPNDWRRVKELFSTAVALDECKRDSLLDAQPDSEEVLDEVRSLLAAYLESPDFLEGSVPELPPLEPIDEPANSLAGRRIGAWQLVREIGRGGMGVVWEARRADHQYDQRAAVKLLRASLLSEREIHRFREERQILASLNHPCIARLLDGGMLEDGSPYLVMEYVDGLPLDAWCDREQLNVRQRLEILLLVCSAVEYAHRQLVIHRDLKPANILVTVSDGTPKLLDFGIAKLIHDGEEEPHATMRLLTPECASPEQVRGELMSTANDVFSLGVLLYKLLTGHHPFAVPDASPLETMRAICELEPRLPSSMAPGRRRELHGELDAVILQALRKNPAERYPSVRALADDLHAWLEGSPVSAIRQSWWRRFVKLIRRYKVQSAAIALAAASLLAGILITSVEARNARRAEGEALLERDRAANAQQAAQSDRNRAIAQEQRADHEAAAAKAINDFLQQDVLAQASANSQARPGAKPDPDLKVRTALDRAAGQISGHFAGQPKVEAAIRQTIGETYEQLGLYPEAQHQLEIALDMRRRNAGDGDPATLASMNALALIDMREARYAEAESLYNTVLEKRQRILGVAHPETLATESALASLYLSEGKYGPAEALSLQVLDIARHAPDLEGTRVLSFERLLSDVYSREGKRSQAEPLLKDVVSQQRRLLGEEHPETLASIDTLSMLYGDEGKNAEAEAQESDVYNTSLRILGPEHPDTLARMSNLALLYHLEGKYDAAEPLFKKYVEVTERLRGRGHPDTLTAIFNLSYIYRTQGKFAEAERLLLQYLELGPKVNGDEHPETLSAWNALGTVYRCQGRFAEAERLIGKALALESRTLGPRHPQTLVAQTALAILHEVEGKDAEADRQLVQALDADRRVLGAASLSARTCMTSLARLRLRQRRYAEAETLLREALNGEGAGGPNVWDWYDRQSLLGASLLGQARFAEAEPLLLSGYDGQLKQSPALPVDVNLPQAADRLVQLYTAWEKPVKADEWRDKWSTDTK